MADNVNNWLNDHGDYLYRFALARLRDPHLAEDAVQETLLAAIKSNGFKGDSSARTWLTGILKHKMIDLQRKQFREQPISDLIDLDASDTSMDDFFDQSGHWLDKPQTFSMPDNTLEQKHLRDQCLGDVVSRSDGVKKVLGIELDWRMKSGVIKPYADM
jgi:RNA polymerase sigma-70 factor (ECF subfamily)